MRRYKVKCPLCLLCFLFCAIFIIINGNIDYSTEPTTFMPKVYGL